MHYRRADLPRIVRDGHKQQHRLRPVCFPREDDSRFLVEKSRVRERGTVTNHRGGVQWKQICKLARELPEVTEGIWFRTPALEVRGKSFVRLKEDGENVVFMLESVEEQEALCEAMGDIYWITDHYRGYPAVMARLSALTEAECRVRLERAWRQRAPKKLIAQLDAPAQAASSRPARARVPARAKTRPRPARAPRARAKAKPKPARAVIG